MKPQALSHQGFRVGAPAQLELKIRTGEWARMVLEHQVEADPLTPGGARYSFQVPHHSQAKPVGPFLVL